MRSMLVLYDSACPFCVRCREWLEARTQEVRLVFVCCRSMEARQRFGQIEGLGRDLVVVDEGGRYWAGPAAFVVCLWALSAFRWLAHLSTTELLWPFARALFERVSDGRAQLGERLLGVTCTGEDCGLPPPESPYR